MKNGNISGLLFCLVLFAFCKNEPSNSFDTIKSGFVTEGSDPKAIAIADKVIAASGSRESWDSIAVLKWSFFGRRNWIWDKKNQLVRVENTQNDTKLILDLKTMQGKVFKYGKEWNDPDTLKKYLEGAYKMWINDMYWLAMPLKMKDAGVHLNYVREDTTQSGIQADVIAMTFDSVGVTPNNKYEVWVGKNSNLVAQWAYFPNKNDSVPSIISPWDAYIKYGGVFLSSDRGPNRQFTGIKVMNSISPEIFKNFDPIDFDHL
ncbi:MAG: hypothetical protein ABI761_18345 [Saprospiraceae bacterium]